MKKLLLLIPIVLLSMAGNAQNHFADSSKSEIGINIIPFMNLMGMETNNPDVLIEYKKHLKKSTFKLGGFIGGKEEPTDLDEKITYLNDSTYISHKYKDYSDYAGLRIGMEWSRKGGTSWNSYIGFDMILGYKEINRDDQPIRFTKVNDSVYEGKDDAIKTFIQSSYYMVGISPVGGFEYYFSRVVSVAVQANLDIRYEFEDFVNNSSTTLAYEPTFNLMVNFHFGKKH
jgi:hypothetical protein